MNGHDAVRVIRDSGLVAIVRGTSLEDLEAVADALMAGGVRAIEVSLTTPQALRMIEELARRRGSEVAIGAGTVLDGESARTAILAGASFLLSPSLSPAMIEMCHRYSVPAIPGAFTPTEVVTAWELGASFVKLFPAGRFGPAYVKDLRGPLPQVDFLAVGGISLANARQFIEAGAVALGVGGELVASHLVAEKAFGVITERAKAFARLVTEGKGPASD